MKWVILALVVLAVTASIDGCHDSKPEYCVRNKFLCEEEGFKGFMHKLCPKSCGVCKDEDQSNEISENSCSDLMHGSYCLAHKFMCKMSFMKHFCQKTCGYCGTQPVTTTTPPKTMEPGKTNPPFTGKCGVPEVKGVRVIAGTTPPRGAWPWQILLTYNGFPSCGGTLISPDWVVCAAHCVYRREGNPSSFVVRVGEHDRTMDEGSEIDIKVAKIIRHPSYSPRNLNNDISLLKLERPVLLNKYVQPACFPSQDPPVGSKCYITGWGKTHHPGRMTTVLQQGLLPVVSNAVCYEKNRHKINIKITDAMICGGSGGTDRISGCHGDSGGPFVCNINGKWELHGSVSHGSPVCKSTDTYTVFSRTNYFKGWIKEMMATN